MNFPNILTTLRIILGFIVPFMLVYGDLTMRIVAAVLFGIAAFTDWLDGWYARKYNLITKFGQIADPIADKIIVLGTFFAFSDATRMDVYSVWWVIPILIREVVITLYRLSFLLRRKPVVVAAESLGKIKTVLQMVTLPFAYFYFMIDIYVYPEGPIGERWIILKYLLYAMLLASLYFTVHSGIEFFVKNWRLITTNEDNDK